MGHRVRDPPIGGAADDDPAVARSAPRGGALLAIFAVLWFRGDLALRGFANVVRKTIRGSDIGVRSGGDESLVLLPHGGLDDARVLAERLRDALAAGPHRTAHGDHPEPGGRGLALRPHPPSSSWKPPTACSMRPNEPGRTR